MCVCVFGMLVRLFGLLMVRLRVWVCLGVVTCVFACLLGWACSFVLVCVLVSLFMFVRLCVRLFGFSCVFLC